MASSSSPPPKSSSSRLRENNDNQNINNGATTPVKSSTKLSPLRWHSRYVNVQSPPKTARLCNSDDDEVDNDIIYVSDNNNYKPARFVDTPFRNSFSRMLSFEGHDVEEKRENNIAIDVEELPDSEDPFPSRKSVKRKL